MRKCVVYGELSGRNAPGMAIVAHIQADAEPAPGPADAEPAPGPADAEPPRGPAARRERPRLREALALIATGDAETLLVGRLGAAAGSLGQLVRLLDWLDATGASLVALDVGFDSADGTVRDAAALLREVERWEREPGPDRRPRGRPGLSAGDPDLARRIAALREEGRSLQAIAEALNREGVPTPRGGREWRPSSVQSVLGYRRPRPPAPGAPRPPAPPPPAPPPRRPGSRRRP